MKTKTTKYICVEEERDYENKTSFIYIPPRTIDVLDVIYHLKRILT